MYFKHAFFYIILYNIIGISYQINNNTEFIRSLNEVPKKFPIVRREAGCEARCEARCEVGIQNPVSLNSAPQETLFPPNVSTIHIDKPFVRPYNQRLYKIEFKKLSIKEYCLNITHTERNYSNPESIELANNNVNEEDNINYKIELFMYKPTKVNNIDNYFYFNNNNKINIESWGYYYYNVTTGLLMRTNYIKNQEEYNTLVEKNIILTDSIILDYNDALPYYIYTDIDIIIKYKIWCASPKYYETLPYITNTSL